MDDENEKTLKETTYFLSTDGDVESVAKDYKFELGGEAAFELDETDRDELDFTLKKCDDVNEDGDGAAQRDTWGGKMEFIFSCLSYAVGLGNIWRYPYLCYKNGGGAFLLPFVIMLVVLGFPMMYLESTFGQYAGSGPITIWEISPLFAGLGWAMFLTTFFASVYYCVLIAWTVFYLFASFNSDVPWKHCQKPWATELCVNVKTQIQVNNCTKFRGFYSYVEHTCFRPTNETIYGRSLKDFLTSANGSYRQLINESNYSALAANPNASSVAAQDYLKYLQTDLRWQSNETHGSYTYYFLSNLNDLNFTAPIASFLQSIHKPKTPSDEYFHNFVLSISNGFHDLGIPKWELCLCLLLCWILIVGCLCKGIKTAGKAVYFTSLFPYFVLTILFIRGIMLEGSAKGLSYYFFPQWEKLLQPKIWADAAVQIFYSLNPCWGGIITLSSYNKFNNNAFLDAVSVVIGDGLTSIFAGMVIFAILGYMSTVMNVPIDEVAQEGAGLAFIVYPDIVTNMPISPLWAVLFFSMLLTLGFGSMISGVNCLYTSILDRWPSTFRVTRIRSFLCLCGICTIMFLIGISCVTPGGIFVLQLLDNYSASYSVLFIGIFELIVIGWVYGCDRFMDNIKEMMGKRPHFLWKIVWKYVTPGFLISITIFNFLDPKRHKYGSYEFPAWTDTVGGLLAAFITLPIPAVFIYTWLWDPSTRRLRRSSRLPWWRILAQLSQPSRIWGPRMGDRLPVADYTTPPQHANKSLFESQNKLINSQTTLASSMSVIHQHRVA